MTKRQKELASWMGMFPGCAIMAIGFVYFINPYNIIPGGVYGASIVLHNIFPSIQVGTFGYMFDIPLLILSVLLLGGKLGSKTIVAALTTPMMMNVLSYLSYPTKEALQSLDPSQLLGGYLDFSNQLVLPVVIGAVLIGIGSGVIVRCGATSGGTDIVAMMLQKFAHLRFSKAILMVDGLVVLFGLIVLGMGFGNDGGSRTAVMLSFYSLICIYLSSRVLARTINGSQDDKMIFIISGQELDELHTFILKKLERTATLIKASGLYSGKEREMLFLVVSYKEVHVVKQKVKEVDPLAFVVVTDAYDTYGEGWKPLPNKDDIQPE